MPVRKTCANLTIITGGQSGADRAALDLALEQGLPCGGWCPKGRLAEDGMIDAKYPLRETSSPVFAHRTELNARDSDGTFILNFGQISGGTLHTLDCVRKYSKPYLLVDAEGAPDIAAFDSWLVQHGISAINIAGPRESLAPGKIYRRCSEYLRLLFLE